MQISEELYKLKLRISEKIWRQCLDGKRLTGLHVKHPPLTKTLSALNKNKTKQKLDTTFMPHES